MKHEDLGRVAELSRSKMRVLFQPRPLTISSVFSELKSLSEISGNTAQTKKKEKVFLHKCDPYKLVKPNSFNFR
jgi:ATP-dependent DNA ligase